jgi:hypothetical protein
VDGCFPTWGGGECDAGVSRSGEAFHLSELWDTGDIVKYEHVPDAYTYVVGDGTAAYTRKIDFFEREFLYVRPDMFVIFDRVQSVDPSYRKVWVMHTVDEPVVEGVPVETSGGMQSFEDAGAVSIANSRNVTTVSALLPLQNIVTVRGGDTVLTGGLPLRPGTDIAAADVLESDIPRWLELFAVGGDAEGTVLLEGDAAEGTGATEAVTFDGTTRDFVDSRPTSDVTSTSLQDTTQSWEPDQWAGYLVRISIGGTSQTAVITGNDASTLFGSFNPGSSWHYVIFKYLANSYMHWQRITRISTTDMDLDDLTVTTPHYFDTEDVTGSLHSFAPHTDGRDDGYHFRRDLGQWTLEIEAAEPALLDVFLNVLALGDPGVTPPAATLLRAEGASGAFLGSAFALFADGVDPLTSVTVTIPSSGEVQGIVLDLTPSQAYSVTAVQSGADCNISIEASGSGVTSSDQGVLSFTVTDCEPCVTDDDGDGYIAESCGGPDCDDSRDDVHPGAPEICDDGVDNDCDGLTDYDDTEDCVSPDAPPDAVDGATDADEDGLDGDSTDGGDEGCGCALVR